MDSISLSDKSSLHKNFIAANESSVISLDARKRRARNFPSFEEAILDDRGRRKWMKTRLVRHLLSLLEKKKNNNNNNSKQTKKKQQEFRKKERNCSSLITTGMNGSFIIQHGKLTRWHGIKQDLRPNYLASYPGQFALSELPHKLDRWRHIRNRRGRLGTRLPIINQYTPS